MLALLLSSPLIAMQPNQEPKHVTYARNASLAAILYNTTIITAAKGGCLVLGPIGAAAIGGVAVSKLAYDMYKTKGAQ